MRETRFWICKLRIIATLAVIWLHTNGTIWGNQELFLLSDGQKRFFAVNYYLMWWAVPVFFMITGYLLLDKNKNITVHDCLFRYVRRVLLALIIFGLFFSGIIAVSEGERSILLFPKAAVGVLTGNTFSHLWYCYELIGIYIVLPIIKTFTDNTKEQTFRSMLIILGVFDFIIPFLGTVIGEKINFYIPFSYTIFYLLYGHWIFKRDRGTRKVFVVIGIVLVMFVGAIAYLMPIENNPFLGYNSPLVAGLAISVLGLFFKSDNKPGDDVGAECKTSTTDNRLWKIDRLCFGVYLIHPLFIQVFYRILGFTPIKFDYYQMGTIVVFITVVIISFTVSWGLYKIPIMKKYVL